MAKRKKKVAKAVPTPVTPEKEAAIESALQPPAEDFGFDEGEADAGPEAASEDDEVAGSLAADDDGYLVPPESVDEGTVVVQDFDPADPGAPIAEPQKVLRPHDRIARKRSRGSRE